MTDAVGSERIGTALRALAEDLVTERRRVLLLRRENRELRAELAALGCNVERRFGSGAEDESRQVGEATPVCPYCQRPLAGILPLG
jgi:hypothetical protein